MNNLIIKEVLAGADKYECLKPGKNGLRKKVETFK